MNFLNYIKNILIVFLTFLLGAGNTIAKPEVVLPQNNVSFSIENTQNFTSLEKDELYVSSVLHSVDSKIKDNIPAEDLRKYIDGDYVEHQLAKKVVNGVDDILPEIFGGARQYVRNTYPNGQDILNSLTQKFGNNQGAAAEIIKKFGDDGLAILNKSTVNSIDDVANELLKGKTAYRHIGSNVSYLKQLKSSGTIPKQIGQGQTYFSLDKIDNPIVAIDKMQLNAKYTDAVWRAEFDATQLVGKTSFPKGKWGNAEYIEILTRSYPNFGSGGASQFITQSSIKLKRLVNLKTGEIINFK